MKTTILLLAIAAMLSVSFNTHAQKMNNQKLIKHLDKECDSISGEDGKWQLFYRGIVILAVTDEVNDRIKLLSPITYIKDIEPSVISDCMKANFENLKDVKYAISNEIIWSIYNHDYKTLSTEQLDEAILQIYYSTGTFGGNYSSTSINIAENN